MAQLTRIKRELEILSMDPGPGVSAWPIDDNMTNLEAQIQGPSDSPYAEGTYTLSVQIPDRYPFEPPRVRFLTPIYHPNIDNDGRICLDTLKMQPQGTWSPSVNINTVLLTIRMLMQTPNADDGLVPEITEEYKRDVGLWRRKALDHTRKNAVGKIATGSAPANEPPSETTKESLIEIESSNSSKTAGGGVPSVLGKRGLESDSCDAFQQEKMLPPVAAAKSEEEDDDGFYF